MSRLALYHARPALDEAGNPTGALLPWELMNVTPEPTQGNPAWVWRATAHGWARADRRAWPSRLVAVRPMEAGPPVYPVNMLDHYDLPPYS